MDHCLPFTRRQVLQSAACGFGALALSGLAHAAATAEDPLARKTPHFAAKAKRVIFLFMQGGPSHVDSFDYKPLLDERDGKMMSFDDARVIANSGMRGSSQRVMKPLWKFKQYGACGRWASDLFPEMNKHVDDLCFIQSVHTEGVAHGPATLFLHCGSTNFIRPSMGSWIVYGLGTENQNLPGFVSIGATSGNGGPRNYGNASYRQSIRERPWARPVVPLLTSRFEIWQVASRIQRRGGSNLNCCKL
ncbi:MAG: arylsulfatase family protein [Planctomycetaceae bacterium]|nr:arylsulfatase family protein [Planctomycetaceae bacterium]